MRTANELLVGLARSPRHPFQRRQHGLGKALAPQFVEPPARRRLAVPDHLRQHRHDLSSSFRKWGFRNAPFRAQLAPLVWRKCALHERFLLVTKFPFVTHLSAQFPCAAAWRSAHRRNGIAGTWAFRDGVAERGEAGAAVRSPTSPPPRSTASPRCWRSQTLSLGTRARPAASTPAPKADQACWAASGSWFASSSNRAHRRAAELAGQGDETGPARTKPGGEKRNVEYNDATRSPTTSDRSAAPSENTSDTVRHRASGARNLQPLHEPR